MVTRKHLIDFFDKHLPAWGVPVALFFASFMAFGLFILWLGFYQDDWHFVYNAYARGSESMWPLLYADGRPFAAWPYVLGFKTLGFSPFAWHLQALILRWLTAVFFWLLLRELWPKAAFRNFAVALVFVIHPFFTLQPLSVAYAPHWTAFLLFTFSLFAMVMAVKERGRLWFWVILSLATTTIHIFTIEYFAGLELVRPLVLWLALERNKQGLRRRLFWRRWIPYLAVFLSFVVWRAWIFNGPRASMPGVQAFFSNPVATIIRYAQLVWADLALILINAWTGTMEAKAFDFSDSGTRNAFVLGIFFALLCFGFLKFFFRKTPMVDKSGWRPQFILMGFLWIVGGLLPAYAIDEPLYLQNPLWNSRLALAALPGAAILIWAIVDWIIQDQKMRVVVLSILAGLAISFHAYNENEFRWAWDEQTKLYQQLALRVPAVQPGTAIISEQEIFSYMGDYPTSYALKLLYASSGIGQSRVPLWYYAVSSNFPGEEEALFSGMELEANRFLSSFRGNSLDALYISFSGQISSCLWVLGPESQDLKNVSSFIRNAGVVSDLERIGKAPSGESMLRDLIGPAKIDWCYFYEKADLSRQFGDWESITSLWDQAFTEGLNPRHGYELLPFAEAFARLGNWDLAGQLTKRANQLTNGVDHVYCTLWSELSRSNPSSLEAEAGVQEFCELADD